jgi:PIN domain nuclease of toxin-antitoxin system
VKALLDTHVFLWLWTEPWRLGAVQPTLADPAHDLVVSAATAWEMAIKYALGKLPLPAAPAHYVPAAILAIGAGSLPVDLDDALAVAELPLHHRDPFDRLLVAQARRHDLTLVTTDRRMEDYDVRLLPVG